MIDPELGFDKKSFITYIRIRKRLGLLPKHIIRLAETIPNWTWEPYNFITKNEFIQWCNDNEIKSSRIFKEWKKENKKPDHIPFHPQRVYDNWSWSNVSGFYHNREYVTKDEFIQWCNDNGINTYDQFVKWCRKNPRPENIPCNPNITYDNWSWGDLSGKYMRINWCSKNEFIQWCKDNSITKKLQFSKWCKENKRPHNIPSHPRRMYDWSWKLLK